VKRGVAAFGFLVGLLALRPPPAGAHAFLDHAEPRVGSSVAAPPTLTLVFTEPVEAGFSHLALRAPDGKPVETPALEQPAPNTLRVALPALAPGEYTVEWGVVSVDTHPTDGRFNFSVKKP
jgi:methionine-rich copper-binding protein CopC